MTSQSQPQRRKTDPLDPVEVAADLTLALKENTAILQQVQRRQRLTAWVLGILIWIVVAGGVLFWEVRQNQGVDCQRDNTLRQGLLDVADFIEESVDRAEEAGTATEEAISRNRIFIQSLRSDFAVRNC